MGAVFSCCSSATITNSPRKRLLKKDPASVWNSRRKQGGMVESYDVLEELGCGSDSALLKVLHRKTGQMRVCRGIVKRVMTEKDKATNNRWAWLL